MKTITFFLLTGLIIHSCDKNNPYEFVEMNFELPATITPGRDTIDLGDTLSFSMNFSDTLKDARSGNSYKIKNFPFNLFLSASKLIDPTKAFSFQEFATHKFTYINSIGNFVNTGTVATHFKLQYSADRYKAICKIVPKERGVFVYNLNYRKPTDTGIPDSILSLPNTSTGKKRIPFLIFPVYIFNNGNNNFPLLYRNVNDIPLANALEWRGTYTFVVR
jgi:hypothetical protein